MIPMAPYELTLFGRDGRVQVRQFENLATAVAAIETLRPGWCRGYRLSIVLESRTLSEQPQQYDALRSATRARP
jgi:hypothetical protein